MYVSVLLDFKNHPQQGGQKAGAFEHDDLHRGTSVTSSGGWLTAAQGNANINEDDGGKKQGQPDRADKGYQKPKAKGCQKQSQAVPPAGSSSSHRRHILSGSKVGRREKTPSQLPERVCSSIRKVTPLCYFSPGIPEKNLCFP